MTYEGITIRELLDGPLQETGDDPGSLVCFYQDSWQSWHSDKKTSVVRCGVDELPTRKFDCGYGGANGPALLAFSEKYVYFSHEYDGMESMRFLPRAPEFVGDELAHVD